METERSKNGYWKFGSLFFRVHDNGTEHINPNEKEYEIRLSTYRWTTYDMLEITEVEFLAAKKSVLKALGADIQPQTPPYYIEGLASYQKRLNDKAKSHLRHKRWGLALNKIEKINELQTHIDKWTKEN